MAQCGDLPDLPPGRGPIQTATATGDLAGISTRLDYLVELGVDAVWLSPFYPSPQRDGGYDVSEYCDIGPLFGTLADFDELISRAHNLGLKILIDIVPNHTSVDHPWFQAAIASGQNAAARDRYIFRTGRGDGSEPPKNWVSLAMRDVLTFWLDRGVDGFRMDVADGMVKAPDLPDADLSLDRYRDTTSLLPMWDQPGVHGILRDWRRLLDQYDDRIAVAEAWVGRTTRSPSALRMP